MNVASLLQSRMSIGNEFQADVNSNLRQFSKPRSISHTIVWQLPNYTGLVTRVCVLVLVWWITYSVDFTSGRESNLQPVLRNSATPDNYTATRRIVMDDEEWRQR